MQRHVFFAIGIAVVLSATAFAQDERGIQVVPREQVQTERAKRWAVLIGVDKYEDEAGITSLKYCSQDMKLLYRVLTGPNGGFAPEQVLLMTQDAKERGHRPTYSNIVTMVPRWLEDAKPEDDVLIAFSGHGITEKGEAYLLPSTARYGSLELTAVSLALVRQWLEACRAERKILVVDACHSGAGKDAPGMSDAFGRELARGKGFVKLASCGADQKSNEDEKLESVVGKGHGVFTYYLAAGLEGKGDYDRDGRVNVDEAYRYAFARTAGWARGKGLRQDPMKSGSVTGVMTIGYYRSLEELQRERQAAESRMKELTAESGRAGTDAARKAIAEAWAKEREALRVIEARLRELESGATDAEGAIEQYRVAVANVQSIESELAAKRRTYTATSAIVRTLAQRLAEAKAQKERCRQVACAPLLAKLKALQSQREAMAREMLPTHPKMKQIGEQIGSVAKELVAVGGVLPSGISRPLLDLDLGGGVMMRLVYIPAGTFMMGGDQSPEQVARLGEGQADWYQDEHPQHRVRITQGFYLGATEITQAQYEAVMGKNPSHFKGKDNPVEQVSWNEAAEFCKKLSEKTGQIVRLPTEAEWEYACRAGTTTPFHTGETISTDQANYDGNSVYGNGRKGPYRKKTLAVGSFAPNAWGLYDMHGNVWEWCGDWYDSGYYGKSHAADPQGPRTGEPRVLRGGSWNGYPWRCRSAFRHAAGPSRGNDLGFRVVVGVSPEE